MNIHPQLDPKTYAQTPWFSRRVDSPVGPLTVVAGAQGLAAILWDGGSPQRVPASGSVRRLLLDSERQLHEYFACSRTVFTLELAFTGTAFQCRVWRALLAIPYGETRSYGQIARQLGVPKAARAVGAAIGRNPIAIMVPCHRVLGSTGELTGFAGGLDVKARLLALEARSRHAAPPTCY